MYANHTREGLGLIPEPELFVALAGASSRPAEPVASAGTKQGCEEAEARLAGLSKPVACAAPAAAVAPDPWHGQCGLCLAPPPQQDKAGIASVLAQSECLVENKDLYDGWSSFMQKAVADTVACSRLTW